MLRRQPSRQPRDTLPIRLREDERRLIEAAAARPEYVTTYIREVALSAARRELSEPSEPE